MSSPASIQRARPPLSLSRAWPFCIIALVSWFANFLHFRNFGYYEDDWYYFPIAFGQSFMARFKAVLPFIENLYQGRPIPLITLTAYAWTGKHIPALPYLFIYLTFTAGALLFYSVLRMRYPVSLSTLAALFFVLSPLTTVRQNLVVQGILGPAFIFVLTAILIRRRHPVAAYLLAIVSIFTYESVFLLFLAAPFFEPGRLRLRKLRAAAIHSAISLGILAAFMLLRWAIGEGRLTSAIAPGTGSLTQKLFTIAAFVPYFAGRSFLTYIYAFWVTFSEHPLEPLVYLAAAAIAAIALYRFLPFRLPAVSDPVTRLTRARQVWWFWNGCIFSLALLALGYLTIYFQITGWIYFFAGRDTRFSLSAVPGSSMFLASLLILAALSVPRRYRIVPYACSLLLLSVLFAYSFIIQSDYARAWDYQKNFYSQAILLTPDLRQDGVLVVRTGLNPQPGFSPDSRPASVGWQRFGMVMSLKSLGAANPYDPVAKKAWFTNPDIVFVQSDDWKDHIKPGPNATLHWEPAVPGAVSESFLPGRVILLHESDDGVLTRSADPVIVAGQSITEPPSPVDLALRKPARESSTYGLFYAFYGVDGYATDKSSPPDAAWKIADHSGLLRSFVSPPARTALSTISTNPEAAGRYFSTEFEPHPWWEVDLGHPSVLQHVRIFNREPDYPERAANLRLLLSNDDVTWTLAYDNRGQLFGPAPLTIDLPDISARYVRVDLSKPGWLHLEEVEVYGR